MNPITKLIDNAMKWSIRPTKDGAGKVYDAAIEADTYLGESNAVYVVRLLDDGMIHVAEVRSGREVAAKSLDECLAILGAPFVGSEAV